MKYLIVDNKEEMRKMLQLTVCNKGDIIIECSDGDEAIEAYAESKPDFVLMDIKMNSLNGIQATTFICEKFPDATIIIVTDYDTPAFRKAAKNAGAAAFFSKENLIHVKEFINDNVVK
jgi:DNA-binding NarL/FixJ family response regulator